MRLGYCGNKGDSGRCVVCGSGMDHEATVLEGARHPHLIKRWLASRDHGWTVAAAARNELYLRQQEDLKEGRQWNRFDGVPEEFELFQKGIEGPRRGDEATVQKEGDAN